MIAIGYDYGTTTSWMAMIRDLHKSSQLVSMKSSLFLDDRSDERRFGEAALRSRNDAGKYVESPKGFIVQHEQQKFMQSYGCSLDDILQDFTKRMLNSALQGTERDQDDAYVTVTIPNSYDGAQMRFMRMNMENVFGRFYRNVHVSLLPEPIAAALHYAISTPVPGGNSEKCYIVTCDMGGGTTDLSVIALNRTRVKQTDQFDLEFKVIASAYNKLLGGNRIDELLFNQMLRDTDCSLNDLHDVVEARLQITEAKERLSEVRRTNVVFTCKNSEKIESEMNRTGLEDRIRLCEDKENRIPSIFDQLNDEITNLKGRTDSLFRKNGWGKMDWSNVILLPIGGSMRIPALRERFASRFEGARLYELPNEEGGTYNSVVYGAMYHSIIMAKMYTGIRNVSIVGRTCMPISIQYLDNNLYRIVEPNMPDGMYTTDCLRPVRIEADGSFRLDSLRFYLRDDQLVGPGDVPDYEVPVNRVFLANGRKENDIPVRVSIDVKSSVIQSVEVFIENIDAEGNDFQQKYVVSQ